MKSPRALFALLAATALGCSATTGPHGQPADITLSRVHSNPLEFGTVHSPVALERALPQVLGQYGYFIAKSHQPAAEHVQFLTEWRTRAAFAGESFTGTPQIRTRLVVDARKRGPRYAFAIYAINAVQDEHGAWRETDVSSQLRGHVREIGRRLTAETK